MKVKILAIFLLSASLPATAQFTELYARIEKLEQRKTPQSVNLAAYDFSGKIFSLTKENGSVERKILEFKDGNSVRLTFVEKHENAQPESKIYEGDYLKMGENLSLRFTRLENGENTYPIVYTLRLLKLKNFYYLADFQNQKWIEEIVKK